MIFCSRRLHRRASVACTDVPHCSASDCALSVLFTTQNGSGEVLFNPHGPVLYGPAERAVCILKRITTAHSSTLDISLCESRPSPRFITPVPQPSASGWVHGWPSSCHTVKHRMPTGSMTRMSTGVTGLMTRMPTGPMTRMPTGSMTLMPTGPMIHRAYPC